MASDDWLQRLYALACRAQGLGVVPDLALLSVVEAWGVYCYLRRILGE